MVAVILSIFPELLSLPSLREKRRSEVSSRVGASHARTQLCVPLALAPLLLDNSFPACGGCFYPENLPQRSQLGAGLSLSEAAKRFITCSTYSCLPCNEFSPMKCHMCNALQCVCTWTSSCIFMMYPSRHWASSRFKKRCRDSRGWVTPQDWETGQCWRQIVLPFHYFSYKFYAPSSNYTLWTLSSSICQKHTRYIDRI